MKISGIICEYNPLHNGHIHHIQQVRQNGADAVVAVMSGNFVQRGDVAVIDKFTRANLAISAGVDLVIELPVTHSLAPAENFALGGVSILSALGIVNEISFGSECGDVELLQEAANACRMCKTEYRDVMEGFLRDGYSYPDVLTRMVDTMCGSEIASVLLEPNNTLAIEYINAMYTLECYMQPFTVKRKGAGHNSFLAPSPVSPDVNIASATYIRNCFYTGDDCHHVMPSQSWNALNKCEQNGKIASIENLERALLYRLRTTSVNELCDIAEVGQGLENRIIKAKNASSLDELLETLRTKRYPLARIRRILLHILLDIKSSDIRSLPPYGRVLAFNDMGRQILKITKGRRTLPFSHSLKELSKSGQRAAHCAYLESKATDIYQLACENIGETALDYKRKITIAENLRT